MSTHMFDLTTVKPPNTVLLGGSKNYTVLRGTRGAGIGGFTVHRKKNGGRNGGKVFGGTRYSRPVLGGFTVLKIHI